MKVSSFSEIEKEFIERVHSIVWCNVATIDTQNRVRSRILHPIWEGGMGWIFTRRHSLKSKHIEHNPHVSLAYIQDVVKPVYADCTAEWVDDRTSKQHIWDLFLAAPPPLGFDFGKIFAGVEDPNCGLLKLTPWRIEMANMLNRDDDKVWLRQNS